MQSSAHKRRELYKLPSQLVKKVLSDFFDKLLQNCKIICCSFILQS